ncbi:MAG TPA: hypothetical protein VNA24_23610, partial [Hyalangium sp.]|nr:hypothetical protein [Hyalangium sp.]
IHRDVKGDNIRVTSEGRVVLLDWGSCWFAGARPLTDTTAPPGTNPYRPPEQRLFMWRFRKDSEARWDAQPSDDLYALGVTLYRLVTGVYLPALTEGGEPVEREILPPSAMATVSLELEALILRLIDEDRHARGSAEQLVREVDEAVRKAGSETDKPILPTTSAVPTDENSCSSDGRQDEEVVSDTDEPTEPSPVTPPWLSLVGAIVVGCMLVFLGWEMHRTASENQVAPERWIATPEEVAQFAPDAGVGEEALSAAQDVPRVVLPSVLSLGRAMPSKPFPGQRRPPCAPRVEREIIGACWIGPFKGQEPPCGDRMFDYEGECFVASFNEARQPTSEQP